MQGVHLGRRHDPQARGLGELHHRRSRIEQAEPRGHRPADGSGHPIPGHARPRARPEQDVERPVATVGDRHLDGASPRIACAEGQRFRGGPGGQRSLERIRRADRDGCCAQGAVSAAAHAAQVP